MKSRPAKKSQKCAFVRVASPGRASKSDKLINEGVKTRRQSSQLPVRHRASRGGSGFPQRRGAQHEMDGLGSARVASGESERVVVVLKKGALAQDERWCYTFVSMALSCNCAYISHSHGCLQGPVSTATKKMFFSPHRKR